MRKNNRRNYASGRRKKTRPRTCLLTRIKNCVLRPLRRIPALFFLLCIFIYFCPEQTQRTLGRLEAEFSEIRQLSALLEPKAEMPAVSGNTEVHFLDVGEGLSILVKSDGRAMLYDGGDRDTSSFVVSYLRRQGIETLDYVIASHYDADHLSGLIGALSLLAYTIGRTFFDLDPAFPFIGRTMGFAVLSLSQIVHTFNVRSPHSVFYPASHKGSRLIPAALLCVFLQCSVILFPPLSQIFKTAPLTITQWLIVWGCALVPLLACEGEKALERRRKRKD